MLKEKWLSHFSYLAVGGASLLLAVFLASRFVQPSYSQDAESGQVMSEDDQDTIQSDNSDNDDEGSDAPTATGALTNNNVVPAPSGEVIPGGLASPVAQSPVVLPGVSFLEPYVYDTREGRRNPFRPPLLADGSLPDVVLPGTPLERYELDELKIAAIMWDVNAPRAMVIDPQGEVHILGKDDRIGRKRGYIAAIREGEVVVVETTNFNGENTFSTRIMRIEK